MFIISSPIENNCLPFWAQLPFFPALILALFHSEIKGKIILFRFYSQSYFILF